MVEIQESRNWRYLPHVLCVFGVSAIGCVLATDFPGDSKDALSDNPSPPLAPTTIAPLQPTRDAQPVSGEEAQSRIEAALAGAGISILPFDKSGVTNASDPESAWGAMNARQGEFKNARTDDEIAAVTINCTYAAGVDSGAVGAVSTEGLISGIEDSLSRVNSSEEDVRTQAIEDAAQGCGELVVLAVGAKSASDSRLEMWKIDPCPGVDFLWIHNKPEECQ